MDDKPSEGTSPEAAIVGVTPDMRVGASEKPAVASPSVAVSSSPKRRRKARSGGLLTGLAAAVGLAGLAASVWVYTEMQREMFRISTELAQLRISLDLYAQRSSAPVTGGAVEPADTGALEALENRLAVLEQNWRGAPPPAALPPIDGAAATAQSDGDCLPSGMRLLVAAGDSYPVCGTDAVVEVMNVANGYISLTDGTTVPSGGVMPLTGTACTISVTSNGDEAETGFAEIRVSC